MKKTKGILKRFSFLREYKVLSDIKLLDEDIKNVSSHLMIGEFGITSVCAFDKRGELYGNENDKSFALVDIKMNREPVVNLIEIAKQNERILRKIMADEKIYSVKIYSAVSLEHKYCKCLVSASDIPVLPIKEFKKFINSSKFEMDNKADKEKIEKAILKYLKNKE